MSSDRENCLALATYRLARRLSASTGLDHVGDVTTKAIAKAVDARVVSLAVCDADDGSVSIVAAIGYARELVGKLHLSEGSGVLSEVCHSRVPLLIDDVIESGLIARPRPRYATRSFLALPLMAGGDLVGVICATDRADGKPFSRADLSIVRALAAPVTLAVMRERSRTQAESLAQVAAIDPVSGIFNRRYFQERIDEELERMRRHDGQIALAMLDIDQFKRVNDAFGHLTGDLIIREVAEVLQRSLRMFDVCARFGGDEFAVLILGNSCDEAVRIADRIRERIAAHVFGGDRALRLTASVGVAASVRGTTVADLMSQADRALYLAKHEGRNRVRTGPAGQETTG